MHQPIDPVDRPSGFSSIPNPESVIQIGINEKINPDQFANLVIEIINVMERAELVGDNSYSIGWSPTLSEFELQRVDAAFQFWSVQYTLEEGQSNG